MSPRSPLFALATLAVALSAGTAGAAPIALTAQGQASGFTLTTFATGFPSDGTFGPFGIAFTANGGVLVSDWGGNVRLFSSHADNQLASAGVVGQQYSTFGALGIANVGANFYLATHVDGTVIQINANGTKNQDIVSGISLARAIVVNPNNNHLFVSGQAGIFDVDPVAKTKTLVLSGDTDGLSLANGILYAARGFNTVQGYDINNFGAGPVFQTGTIAGADGTAVGSGTLAGKLFVNTNFGELYQVDLNNPANRVLIASQGTRGDFVTVDPLNGTLLVTQSDRIVRLTAPAGGGFGTLAAAPTPEPATLTVFGALAAGAFLVRRRKAARATVA